jgi:hypothetical protein
MGSNDQERRYLHRILDALMFRVLPGGNQVDNGFFSLGMKFHAVTKAPQSVGLTDDTGAGGAFAARSAV